MPAEIQAENLKQGLLGLLVALVEIIRDALRVEALKRLRAGSLTDDEADRLGTALQSLDRAIEELKAEHDLGGTVRSVREQLDRVVEEIVFGAADEWPR